MEFAVSFLLGVFLTVICIHSLRTYAGSLGLVDLPSPRKHQVRAVPRVGGIGIALSGIAATVLFVESLPVQVPFVLACIVILIVGVVDDKIELNYKYKLLTQIIAISICVFAGFRFHYFPFFGVDELPTWLSIVVTYLFLLGVTNAVNLSDGLDGLAGGCTLITLGAIAVLSIGTGDGFILPIALAIMGGIFGFLRYNSYPATLFMGDAGSQFLGFSVGFLAMHLVNDTNTALSPSLPFLLVGLPMIDTVAVFIRRLLLKRSPFIGDRQHLHHRLLDRGLTHAETVSVIYLVQSALVGFAYFARYESDILLVGVLIGVGSLFVGVIYLMETRNLRIEQFTTFRIDSTRLAFLRNGFTYKFRTIAAYSLFSIYAAYILFSASFNTTAYSQIAVFAVVVSVASLLGYFLFRRYSLNFVRLAAYVALLISLPLISSNQESSALASDVSDILIFVIIIMILIVFILHNVELSVTPQDLIILFIIVSIALLPSSVWNDLPVARTAIYLASLYYALEYVIQTKSLKIPAMLVSIISLLVVSSAFI